MIDIPPFVAAALGGADEAAKVLPALTGYASNMLSALSRIADNLDVVVEDIERRYATDDPEVLK